MSTPSLLKRRKHAAALARQFDIAIGKDYHTLTSQEVKRVIAAADAAKYSAPKNANDSRARYFYSFLCRTLQNWTPAPASSVEERETKIRRILNANYEGMIDARSSLVDLIADAMHFARVHEIDFDKCVRSAIAHVEVEKDEM